MTECLYHQDAYLTQFEAVVCECVRTESSAYRVRLNRTAFYPTSGGQPYDTGTLHGAQVVDVYVDDLGDIWHAVDAPMEIGATVSGQIDWARRFDHMQQHAGDHMMAGVIYHMLGGYTVGLHVSAQVSTIDVVLGDGRMRLDEAELIEIERRVNGQIQKNLPIRCWFPDEAELASLPLRKDPTVSEHVRVVRVGDVECVACGGTHPDSSGQLGLLKILDARPSRGKMRITFVCGMRAVEDYQAKAHAADRAAALLSTHVNELPDAVERVLERAKQAEYERNRARLDAALEQVPALRAQARALPGGWHVDTCIFGRFFNHLRFYIIQFRKLITDHVAIISRNKCNSLF